MKAKRIMIVACCVIIASLGIVLAGCGGVDKYADSQYVGKWVSHTAEYAGVEVSVEDAIGEFSYTLNADGSATMTQQGETIDSKWQPNDDGIQMSEGDDAVMFADEDGKLTTEMEGVKFIFDKE